MARETRRTTRRGALAALAILATAAAAARPAAADELRNVKVGDPMPPIVRPTLDGDRIDLGALKGRVVVLVYLAAEQRSSETVAARAAALAKELADQPFSLVFMTADVTRVGHFRELRDRVDAKAPVALDVAREAYGALGLVVLPTTLVVDEDGRLAHVIASARPDYDHYLRSTTRHALGLLTDAELEAALSASPIARDRPADRVARHRAAARQLRANRLDADAERELRAALAIDPNDEGARLDLAALLLDAERADDAEPLVRAVLEVDPDQRRARMLLGLVHLQHDRLDEAKAALEEALVLNTDPVRAHFGLGLIAEKRGDAVAAAAHFKEAAARMLRERP